MENILNPNLQNNDEENIEKSLRPSFLTEYIGQAKRKLA